MKRLFALLLSLALCLSLAACGADGAELPAPPTLTVTNAAGDTVTAESWSYDWDYSTGYGEWMGVVADSAHPLDESCRELMPVLEMPVTVSVVSAYVVTLDFGAAAPQSVSIRRWGEECWGDFEAKSETSTAEAAEDGTYTAVLTPSIGIFAVDAVWDTEKYNGRATYCFRAVAENVQTLSALGEYRFDASQVKKLDVSWLGGSVIVQRGAQTESIVVGETCNGEVSDDERMTCTLAGDTLRVRILPEGFTGSLSAQKYLTVYVPDTCALDEIEIEASSAYVSVDDLTAREVEISTVSGSIALFGNYAKAEIETTGGDAVLAGTYGVIDFESVSGSLISDSLEADTLTAETGSGAVTLMGSIGTLKFDSVSGDLSIKALAALALAAKTTSGSVSVSLPGESGVEIDFVTTSGVLDTALTQRDGTMVACGEEGYRGYIVPGAPGADACSIAVSSVSGDLTITEFSL